MQEQVVREPRFDLMDILERNGGCMPFWDLATKLSQSSGKRLGDVYELLMQMIRNRELWMTVLRKKKCNSKLLVRILPEYGATWITRDRETAVRFIFRIREEARARISASELSHIQKGGQWRIAKDICDSVLVEQLGVDLTETQQVAPI
jgi:hypothetical protein